MRSSGGIILLISTTYDFHTARIINFFKSIGAIRRGNLINFPKAISSYDFHTARIINFFRRQARR
jgi:hypothetical protein